MTPLAHHMTATLPLLAEMLAAQLVELHKDPTPDRCDRITIELANAQTQVRRLCSELLRDDAITV
jgi:hypothetical protein